MHNCYTIKNKMIHNGIACPQCGEELYDKYPEVDINKVKSIANANEKIDRDERSGEILSGTNTYIFVEFDYHLRELLVSRYMDILKEKILSMDGLLIKIL